MIKQFAKLTSLVLACGICFYLGMLADSEKNKLESQAVVNYFKGELDSIETQVAELEAKHLSDRQEIARTILMRLKLSCEAVGGFQINSEFYVCVPGAVPQENQAKPQPQPKKDEYVL
jgi:hypothetical protein